MGSLSKTEKLDDKILLSNDVRKIKNELSKQKKYKYLCKALWNHIMQDVQSTIKPCCVYCELPISREKYDNLTDAFLGEEFDEIRQRMLNGEKIKGCNGCYIGEDAGEWTLRNHFNKIYDDSTIKNPRIRDIEISFDNKCNFECVTCSAKFSTAWYEDDNAILEQTDLIRQKALSIENQIPYVKNISDLTKIDYKYLKNIRCAGGEPFMNKELLEWLSSMDLSDIELTIITNNSIFPKKWIETIKTAKKFRLIISCDGIGEVGEFVRYGMKQRVFSKNIKKWQEIQTNRIIISFNYVVHAMNVLNVEKTYNWIREMGIDESQYDWYNKLMNAPKWDFLIMSVDRLYFPEYIDLRYLPNETKKIIHEYYNKMGPLDGRIKDKILKWMDSGETNIDRGKDFINYCNFLERRRIILPEETEIIYNSVLRNIV
jgi:organic radical activating enzyme